MKNGSFFGGTKRSRGRVAEQNIGLPVYDLP